MPSPRHAAVTASPTAASGDEADTVGSRKPTQPPSGSIRISSPAFEQARDIAPGWDRYALEQIYIAWATDKEPARSEDARFLGWVRSYTKGRPAP